MNLRWPFATRHPPERRLYEAIVAAARHASLYQNLAVPDTMAGRFEMLVLHVFLVLRRLSSEGQSALLQSLVDLMFKDLEAVLREQGAGDAAVVKKMRGMAESYYGRATAYERALAAGRDKLAEALTRNVYPDGTPEEVVAKMADYVFAAAHSLEKLTPTQVVAGEFNFP